MRRQFFFLCVFVLFASTVCAQAVRFKPDQFSSRVNSSFLADPAKPVWSYNDSLPVAVYDRWDEHVHIQNGGLTQVSPYAFKSIHNFIRVGVNHDTALHVGAYKYRVQLQVLGYDPLVNNGNTPISAKSLSLTFSYDPDSLHSYNDLVVEKFSGMLKFQVVVLGVYDVSSPNNPPMLLPRNALAKNFYIECEVQTQRHDASFHQLVPECTPLDGNQKLKVNWVCTYVTTSNYCKASSVPSNKIAEIKPILYELEWTYIDDYIANRTTSGPQRNFRFSDTSHIPYDFRRNSTRVQTDKTSFEIPLLYEHGAIIYRVRAVRPVAVSGYKDVEYTAWSLPDSGVVDASNSCFPGQGYRIIVPHMDDSLNWSYAINFAEEGKYKHVTNYFDGAYKERQTQTKLNTDPNYIIAIDKVYDYEGRPSLTTLPIPITQQNVRYRSDLIQKTGGQLLGAADIDKLGCILPDSLPPLATTAPANIYYSPSNPDTFDHHKFLPDAKGYPFVQTMFSPEDPGKVLWQGSAGYELQAFKKPTRYEYVKILPGELDRLQGTEAGRYEFYPKEVVTDPNGQTSFKIMSAQGKVVAQGLQGLPDTAGKPLDLLGNWVPGISVCSDLLRGVNQQKLPGNLRAEKVFYVDVNGQNSFQYSVAIPPFFPGCSTTNKYLWSGADAEVKVFTDCGDEMGSIVTPVGQDSVLSTNTSMYFASTSQNMTLQKGKYMITKELKFSEYNIKKQVDTFIVHNQPVCYNDEPFFVRKAVENASFPCVDSGSLDPCGMKRKQMMRELYPGAKYGGYFSKSDGAFLKGDTNSIFSFVIDSSTIGNGALIYQNGNTPQCQITGCEVTQACFSTFNVGCGCPAGAHNLDNPCCSECVLNECACIKFPIIRTIDTTYIMNIVPAGMRFCEPIGAVTYNTRIVSYQDPCYSGSTEFKFEQQCDCGHTHSTPWMSPYSVYTFPQYCDTSGYFYYSPNYHGFHFGYSYPTSSNNADYQKWQPFMSNWLFQLGNVKNHYAINCTPHYYYIQSSAHHHQCMKAPDTTYIPHYDTTYAPLAGSIYFRYQSPCVTLPSINYNGQMLNLKQIPVDSFIARFNDDVAAALLPLHPEYCKLLACNDGGYQKQLEDFTTYKEAETVNRFKLDSIILNDPVYKNASLPQQTYAQLSTLPNIGKRIDRMAMELVYCGAGNQEEVAGCAAALYPQEIQNFTFASHDMKQRYFETLRSLYISNRNFITQMIIDQTGNSCLPCPGVRMNLTGAPVFDTVFDATGSLANDNMPQWMQALFDSAQNGTLSGTDIPPQVLDSVDAINQKKLRGEVAAIMKRLSNCSLDTNALNQIEARLIATGLPVTVVKVSSAIANAGVGLNDLCHPFLVNYHAYDNAGKDDKKFDCHKEILYSGMFSFFNRSGMVNALLHNGQQVVPLNLNNPFEKAISDHYNGCATVKVTVTPKILMLPSAKPLSTSYTELKVLPDPLTSQIIPSKELYFFISGKLDTLNSFVPSSGACLNDVENAMKDGLVAQKTAVLYAYVNGSSTATPFFIWNNKIDLMKAISDVSIGSCISCKEIKNALEDFKADKSVHGYDDAYNHPLFEYTLTNYLNEKLKRSFAFYDYYDLMKGCAVTDHVSLKRHGATFRIVYADSSSATGFVQNLSNAGMVVKRMKAGSQTQLYLDLNVVPRDSLLWYKTQINSLAGSAISKDYLPTTNIQVYAKNGIASLSTAVTNLFGSYTTQQVYIDENGSNAQYTVYNLNNSFSTPYNHAQFIAVLRDTLSGLPGVFAIYNAELLRSGDYNSTLKQAYLANVYGIVSNDRSDVIDSISTAYLSQHVSAFMSKQLSYDDPYSTRQKTDLYVLGSINQNHPGLKLLRDSILTMAKNYTGGYIFFSAPYTNILGSLGATAVIKKVNGIYWYRFFRPQPDNRLFNAYIKPPKYTQYPLSNYLYSHIKPTYGKDSVRFFNAYLVYNGDTIVCKGYTDFPIGYCQKVENVILQERAEPNSSLDSLDCEHDVLWDAIIQGRAAYLFYFDSTRKAVSDSMIHFLVDNAKDTLNLCAQEAKYQYTLYYYDRAGNLTRTIPPQGVNVITSGSTLNQVNIYRDSNNASVNGQSLTAHKKVSVYKYNAQNQLYYQETPDGGATFFFYDGAGRLLFSQNSKQRKIGNYSYTLYDKLGRVAETGEVKLGCVLSTNTNAVFDTTHCSFTVNGQTYTSIHPPYVEHSHNNDLYPLDTIIKYIGKKSRTNVVMTIYDTATKDLGAIPSEHLSSQEHLIHRVSSILYYPTLYNTYQTDSNYVNPHFGTYYSYDPQGNVKTITYEYAPLALLGQKYKRVDYEYDVLSGKVTQVSYNRSKADQFFHRYEYDADNRITAAYTSKDGLIWNKDARYKYYHHGPLANVTLGDLKVQSVDYAYTITGWLKAINGDVLRPDLDMGRNGAAGDTVVARDVLAHALDYFVDDYKSVSSQSPVHLPATSKSLYNGNIVRQTTSIAGLDNMQRHYRYDQLHRLLEARNILIDESNLQTLTTPLNLYKSTYAYDQDGNIQTLTRYDGSATPGLLDNFTYQYTANNQDNRLLRVSDATNTLTGGRDLQPGQPANNYEYDAIGNMVKDRQGHINISWFPNGKPEIIHDTVANTLLKFTYDGLGNRIFKSYVRKISSSQEDHKGAYYVRDASGNILAVYNTHSTYSPVQVVKATLNPIKNDPGFPVFVIDNIATKASFKPKLIKKALDDIPVWAYQETTKPISFYLERDEDIFNRVLLTNGAYLDELRQYDNDQNADVFVNSLLSLPYHTEMLLQEILRTGTQVESKPEGVEALAVLQHFDEQMPEELTSDVWKAFDVPYVAGSWEENAQNLYSYMRDAKSFTDVATQLQKAIEVEKSERSRAFIRSVINDDVIFHSDKFREKGIEGGFEYTLASALYKGAPRSTLMEFFDQWSKAGAWLEGNTALDWRLGLVYDADPNAVVSSFINASMDDDALEEVIAEVQELPALKLVYDVLKAFPNKGGAIMNGLPLAAAADTITLSEHHLYGSSRLGIQTYDTFSRNTYHVDTNIARLNNLSANRTYYSSAYGDYVQPSYKEAWGGVDNGALSEMRTLGKRFYELTDHLGNVLATVMDRRTGGGSSGVGTLYSHWKADIATATDYYPFGMMMPGRYKMMNGDTAVYRFGFNGHEKDNEIKGIGNSLNFGARMLDTRLGRWLSLDPLATKYPFASPYNFALNSPIQAKDPDGKVVIFINGQHGGSGGKSDYWRVFSTEKVGSRSEKDGFGRWHTSGSKYQTKEVYAFDKALMNRIGDHKAIYRDGSSGGWANTLLSRDNLSDDLRKEAGYKQGAVDAKDIIANLQKDDKGNITETIKIVTHSMGGAYGKGWGQAVLDYADKNKINGVKIEFEADFAPFQPEGQKAIKHPNMGPTYQFSHSGDKVAGDKPIEGAQQMDTSSDPQDGNGLDQHQISNFQNSSEQIRK